MGQYDRTVAEAARRWFLISLTTSESAHTARAPSNQARASARLTSFTLRRSLLAHRRPRRKVREFPYRVLRFSRTTSCRPRSTAECSQPLERPNHHIVHAQPGHFNKRSFLAGPGFELRYGDGDCGFVAVAGDVVVADRSRGEPVPVGQSEGCATRYSMTTSCPWSSRRYENRVSRWRDRR